VEVLARIGDFFQTYAHIKLYGIVLVRCREKVLKERVTEQVVMEECGELGIRRMVAAFYARVKMDDLIGPMYPDDDWEGSEERLAEFLLFRLGASMSYVEKRGHPRLRMRHVKFKIGEAERDRWLELMSGAMDETAVSVNARQFLEPFFQQVADFMRNQPSGA